jgi:glutathione synthase/RimK-type ligase-like ATP-grasp enzyme
VDPRPAIALITDQASADRDADLAPLAAALEALGAAVDVGRWDDDARRAEPGRMARFDLAVVRSPWRYHWDRDGFLAWTRAAAAVVPVHNPVPVLEWNTDKRYLADLAAAGLPVTPTTFVAPGDPLPSDATMAAGGGDVVVKPTVSAGAKNTARYRSDETAAVRAHVDALHAAGKTAMVQPYLEAVDTAGETALVYVDGASSHALRKGPLLRPGAGLVDGLYAEEEIEARQPSADERALGARVLSWLDERFGGPPLYARLDVIGGPDGRPVVLEVELTEPSLFHAVAPGSAERFAGAILARLR